MCRYDSLSCRQGIVFHACARENLAREGTSLAHRIRSNYSASLPHAVPPFRHMGECTLSWPSSHLVRIAGAEIRLGRSYLSWLINTLMFAVDQGPFSLWRSAKVP